MPDVNKKYLKHLIGNGETEQALEVVLSALPESNSYYNKFTLLKGQLTTAQEQIKLGTESRMSVEPTLNRISLSTLEFLEKLSDLDFSNTNHKNIREVIQKVATVNSINYEYDIFFSFSSKDIEFAKDFCDQLRGYGLRVFFSADDMRLKGGHQFSEVIDEALEHSRHFLLLSTRNSMVSEWVKIEYTTFHDQIYIKNRKDRRFFILEGHDFDENLLRISYRNIQRVKSINDVFGILLLYVNEVSELDKQKRLEEEKRKQAELAEQKRLEEEKRKQAELAEQKRQEEEKRKQAELAEQKRQEEEKRKQAELAEQKRQEEEKRKQTELAEQKRLQEEKRIDDIRFTILISTFAFVIFTVHYAIRIYYFSNYETLYGFWPTILMLSLVPALLFHVLFFASVRLSASTNSNLFGFGFLFLCFCAYILFLIYGLYKPMYTYYAFDLGLLRPKIMPISKNNKEEVDTCIDIVKEIVKTSSAYQEIARGVDKKSGISFVLRVEGSPNPEIDKASEYSTTYNFSIFEKSPDKELRVVGFLFNPTDGRLYEYDEIKNKSKAIEFDRKLLIKFNQMCK